MHIIDYRKRWRLSRFQLWKPKLGINWYYCHWLLLFVFLPLSERCRRRAISLQENPAYLPAAKKHDESFSNSWRGPQHCGIHYTHRWAPPGGPGEGGRGGWVRPIQGEAAGLRSAMLQCPGWRDAQQGAGPEEEQPAAAHLIQVQALRAQWLIKEQLQESWMKCSVLLFCKQSVKVSDPEADASRPATAAAVACSHCVSFLNKSHFFLHWDKRLASYVTRFMFFFFGTYFV